MADIVCIGGVNNGLKVDFKSCSYLEAVADTCKANGLSRFSSLHIETYKLQTYLIGGEYRRFYVFNKLRPNSKATFKKVQAYA